MESEFCWQLFLKTGSPEAYLLFKNQRRMEEADVLENPGPGVAGHDLQ